MLLWLCHHSCVFQTCLFTSGVRSGMASRKTVPVGRRTRKGLRSQRKTVLEDVAWDTLDEEEEDAGACFKTSSPQHTPVTTTTKSDMVSLMQDILSAQQKWEEGLIYELWGLRESIQRQNTPESPQSLCLQLPTPAAPHNVASSVKRYQTSSPPPLDSLGTTELHPRL